MGWGLSGLAQRPPQPQQHEKPPQPWAAILRGLSNDRLELLAAVESAGVALGVGHGFGSWLGGRLRSCREQLRLAIPRNHIAIDRSHCAATWRHCSHSSSGTRIDLIGSRSLVLGGPGLRFGAGSIIGRILPSRKAHPPGCRNKRQGRTGETLG